MPAAADVASEARLTRLLRDYLPGSQVVGEEAVAERPEVLDLVGGSDPVWLVDPVDGTANFAAGRKTFAVMVALVHKGAILACWVHEPTLERTAVAEAGGGAWLGDTRLRVAEPVPITEMHGTLHAGSYGDKALRRPFKLRASASARSRRCAVPAPSTYAWPRAAYTTACFPSGGSKARTVAGSTTPSSPR